MAAILLVCCGVLGAHAGQPPNIVVLLADDLGYAELGCQGHSGVSTPAIDSIARRGVRFTDGYVTAPFCSASRAGLLSGRYQTRFGYEFNPIGARNVDPEVGLPASERTLAERLHELGYATALVGKWHVGGHARYHPLRHGFDEFFGFLHEGHFYVPPPYRGVVTMLRRRRLPGGATGRVRFGDVILSTHMRHDEPPYDADNPILRHGQPVVETEYLTDAFTREAVSFVRRHRERPFFLYVAYNAVHSPLQARRDDFERVDVADVHRRIFLAMLARLDRSVGAILGELERQGLLKDTLVFFLSDNGGPTRELTSSNRPLRGEKGMLWEGGIRVPFLMQWPRQIAAGQQCSVPVVSLDVYATAVHVAQGLPPGRAVGDGIDLRAIVRPTGAASAGDSEGKGRAGTGAATASAASLEQYRRRPLYWRVGSKAALRRGRWKIVRNPDREHADDRWRLYDLQTDIGEEHDVSAAQPERLRELVGAWERLNGQMKPPAWGPR